MVWPPLTQATLIRRYRRFLADVLLPGADTPKTVHCPNTGAMTGCAPEGARVWLTHHDNPQRKYPWTLELVDTEAGLACVHSARANQLVSEAITSGVMQPLVAPAELLQREVRFSTGTRIDFCLGDPPQVFVEVKSVTLYIADGLGRFPDAPGARGSRHIRALMSQIAQGHRAALVFCVLHEGVRRVEAARSIDPVYATLLDEAIRGGLEVYTLLNQISLRGITPLKAEPWDRTP